MMKNLTTTQRLGAGAVVLLALVGSTGCDSSATDLANVSLVGEWVLYSSVPHVEFGQYRRFLHLTVSESANGSITGTVVATENCSGQFKAFEVTGEFLVPDVALPVDIYGNLFRGKVMPSGDQIVGTLYRSPGVFQRYDGSMPLTGAQACRAFSAQGTTGSPS